MEKRIAALGNSARLGQLYNEKNSHLLSESIFNIDITKEENQKIFTEYENATTNVDYAHDATLTKRFDLLHVEAEIKVSVLCGLIGVSGSGKYLSETKSSNRAVTSSMIVSVKTLEQSFQINNKFLKPLLVTNLNTNATHYVGAIKWGGNSIISVTYLNNEEKERQEIEGILSAKLEKLAFAIEGKGRVEVNNEKDLDKSSFSFSFQSDSFINNAPQSIEEAMETMKKIPEELRKANNGKGKQVEFVLYPIERLREVLKLEIVVDNLRHSLDLDCMHQITAYFSEVETISGRIFDLSKDFEGRFFRYIPPEDLNKFLTTKNSMNNAFLRAKRDISEAVSSFRNGEISMEEVRGILEEKCEGVNSPEKCKAKLFPFEQFRQKFNDINDLTSKYGFVYIGKGDNWQGHFVDSEGFILYFSWPSAIKDPQSWLEAKSMLVQLQKENLNSEKKKQFLLLDSELVQFNVPGNIKPIAICFYRNSIWQSIDIVGDRYKEQAIPTVKLVAGAKSRPVMIIPNDRVKAVLTCPLIECGVDCHRWQCNLCKEELEYVECNNCFYCKCGESSLDAFSFRCPSLSHGLQFNCYDYRRLESQLSKLKENILYIVIMGETGTGKSTFINSLANYLQNNSLTDSIKSKEPLISLIYNQYTLPDSTGKNVTFEIGEKTKDETPSNGQSSTQRPKTYSFYVGNFIIKLIDTPGINDVRGLIQDKENLESILAYLGLFKKIHAFLYLVPANLPRLTEQFQYCFKQLIARLHISAANNILFVYTKCRSALYTGGSTHGLMDQLCKDVENRSGVKLYLNNYTQYYVDNEALALLAGVKNGHIHVNPEVLAVFEDSWKFSSKQCALLLNHITKDMQPHLINDTVSLNNIRQVFGKFAQPIALISHTIEKNIAEYQMQEARLQNENLTISQLKDQLMVDQTVVKTIPLSSPRTVCTHADCCKRISGDLNFTVYTQFCHDPCSLPPNIDLIPNPHIRQCWCINGNTCRECSHGWENHMHVNVEYRPETIRVISTFVEDRINQAAEEGELTKNILEEYRKEREALELEKDHLRTAAAKLAVFLRKNAIIPYDDTVGNLINKEIEMLTNLPNKSTKQVELLEKLNIMYRQYREEVETFEEMTKQGVKGICSTVAEAQSLIDSLYSLKFIGPQLRQSMDAQKIAKPVYEEKSFAPPKKSFWRFWKSD